MVIPTVPAEDVSWAQGGAGFPQATQTVHPSQSLHISHVDTHKVVLDYYANLPRQTFSICQFH